MTDLATPDPTLRNVLDQTSLKWVFVGGKGGVGKTTTSSSLAVQLASVRSSVLIISTGTPPHAPQQSQHQCHRPCTQPQRRISTKVYKATDAGQRLFQPLRHGASLCMPLLQNRLLITPFVMQEVDPNPDMGDLESMDDGAMSFVADLAGSIPGIDEAMSFAEVMRQVC